MQISCFISPLRLHLLMRRMLAIAPLLAGVISILIFSCATAAESFSAPHVTGEGWMRKDGEQLQVVVKLTIPMGYYLYHTEIGEAKAVGLPLRFAGNAPVKSGVYAVSAPIVKKQPLFDGSGRSLPINVHLKQVLLYLKLPTSFSHSAPIISVEGQMCSDTQCLPVKLDLPILNSEGNVAAEKLFGDFPPAVQFQPLPPFWAKSSVMLEEQPGGGDVAPSVGRGGIRGAKLFSSPVEQLVTRKIESRQAEALPIFQVQRDTPERALLLWLLIAFFAGILLNFMPCVLPVISLKIVSFMNQSGESRRRLILHSLAFAAGLISIFMILAGLAIGLGLHWGEQFQSETFNIVLAVLVFAFSLSFFSVYEFGVPDAANRLQAGTLPREGYLGAFSTGMLATVLATPCSGPFLGATLSWALAQPPLTVLLVFFFLGLGMSMPYVLLSVNLRLRSLLPKPGAWMVTFRQCMGFLLLLTVVYLLSFVEDANIVPTCAVLVMTAFGCWLIGKYASFLHSWRTRWLVRLVALLLVGGSVWLAFGPFKPFLGGEKIMGEGAVQWKAFDEEDFLSDLRAGRNVLLDFTADWCPNCKYNEYAVFSSSEIVAKLEAMNVVAYIADLTADTPHTGRLRELLTALGGAAIPYAAIFPGDQPYRPYVLPDILTVSQLLSVLEKLPKD